MYVWKVSMLNQQHKKELKTQGAKCLGPALSHPSLDLIPKWPQHVYSLVCMLGVFELLSFNVHPIV